MRKDAGAQDAEKEAEEKTKLIKIQVKNKYICMLISLLFLYVFLSLGARGDQSQKKGAKREQKETKS